jgi:hypothetical protein
MNSNQLVTFWYHFLNTHLITKEPKPFSAIKCNSSQNCLCIHYLLHAEFLFKYKSHHHSTTYHVIINVIIRAQHIILNASCHTIFSLWLLLNLLPLKFVSPCIIIQLNKSTNQMQQFLQFITWGLFTTQHVPGVLTPITRSSTTGVAASGFTFGAWWHQCCWSWSAQLYNYNL